MRRSRTFLLAGIVAALVLALAACGGDDDSGDAAAGSTAAAAGGPTVTIGYSAWPGWFPLKVAEEKGFFEQAGVDVKLRYFTDYIASLDAFTAGQIDGNTQTLNDTIASVAAGSDQKIVLVNDNSTGNDQIIVDSSIKSIADLKGKKVAVEVGVVDHFLLAQGLRKAGMSLADVTIVPLETGAAAAAFAAGQVDAVGAFPPFTTQAAKRSGSHVLFSSKDFPGAIPDHLVLSGDLIKERPEDVQKIVNVWFKTLDYMKANPAKALSIMSKRAGVSEAEYKEYDAGTTLFTLQQNIDAFASGNDMTHLDFATKEISKFLQDNGFIEKPVSPTDVLVSTFIRAYVP